MKSKLEAGEFVLLAEMEPPKGVDVSEMVTNVTRIKGLVDGCVVPEMNSAVMRMSSLGGAVLLQGIGMPAIMQVNCRDRNRLALQADLLAAYACGVRGIMAVTGDDPRFGDHPQAKPVYDIGLMDLLQAMSRLQQGRDMAGIELQGPPSFKVGSTINPGVKKELLNKEVEDFEAKLEAGVTYFITPALFELDSIAPFLEAVSPHRFKLIPSVLLLKSLGMARYIARNIEHIHIPDTILKRIQKAAEKERESVKIAAETATMLKNAGFGGVIITTMGWEQKIPEIIEAMRG
ncbi:MAG: methylenetetrahydrofolate reductase [Desulfovermiculus sp.]|nr:methylenetetrahydrofolate reductase [Desulfovermiculus sp.]